MEVFMKKITKQDIYQDGYNARKLYTEALPPQHLSSEYQEIWYDGFEAACKAIASNNDEDLQ